MSAEADNDECFEDEFTHSVGDFEEISDVANEERLDENSENKRSLNILLGREIVRKEDAAELLNMFEIHSNVLDPENIVKIIRALSKLVKKRDSAFVDVNQKSINHLWEKALQCHFSKWQVMDVLRSWSSLNFPDAFDRSLFKLVAYHIDDMNLNELMELSVILNNHRHNEHVIPLCDALPYIVGFCITKERLTNCSPCNLRKLFSYCNEHHLKQTSLVVRELDNFELSTKNAISYLWTVCHLPQGSMRSYCIKKDDELYVDVLTKRCYQHMTAKINLYDVDQLRKILFTMNLSKIQHGIDDTYRENFFEALCERAVSEEWHLSDLNSCCKDLFVLGYINESLVRKIFEVVLRSNSKHLKLDINTFVKVMGFCNIRNPEFLKIIEEHPFFTNIGKAPFLGYCSRINELLSLGWVDNAAVKQIFSEEFILKNIKMVSFELSLLRFRLEQLQEPVALMISPLIKEVIEENVNRYVFRNASFKNSSSIFVKSDLTKLLGEDVDKVLTSVIYKESLPIDYLLIVNTEGKPVKVHDNHTSTELLSFDSLEIPYSCKKIAFILLTPNRDILRPNNYISGKKRLLKMVLEDEGFYVILSVKETKNQDQLRIDYDAVRCSS